MSFQTARRRLSQLRKNAALDLQKKHQGALKYISRKKLLLPGLMERSKQLLAGASLAGSLIFNPITKAAGEPALLAKSAEERAKEGLVTSDEISRVLADQLGPHLPADIGKLTPEQDAEICRIIKENLGVDVCTELDTFKLNYDYAWTGYEQHLFRYPGDDLAQHDGELQAGIAPGLGAWGYFADSKQSMTKEEYLREKYYVVVQTLYFNDWNQRSEEIYQFFKYRKMIMINPENGTACVAVVGDAGPAQWTGKQFGACPEVMKELDLHENYRKGKVLLLFVDDPENKIPLGPVETNLQTGEVKTA